MRFVAAVAFVLLEISPVQAAPVTYACSLYASSGPGSDFEKVDRITIDRDVPSIELRDSSTSGTVNELVMRLTGTAGPHGENGVVTFSTDDVWRAAGFWKGVPYSLRTGGTGADFVMILTVAGGFPAQSFMYDCPLT